MKQKKYKIIKETVLLPSKNARVARIREKGHQLIIFFRTNEATN